MSNGPCAFNSDTLAACAMARHKLEMDPDPEVILIGISCHVNDYRLCWALNRALGINLSRRDRDITEPGPERMANYSVFEHIEPESQALYVLVNNHCGDGVLLREHRQADFFLIVDEHAPTSAEELLEQVRRTEFVLAAYPLDARNERGAHKLLQ